jgi:hypothetical protein
MQNPTVMTLGSMAAHLVSQIRGRIASVYNELVWRLTVKKIRSDRGGIGDQLEKPLRDSDRSAERIFLGRKIHFVLLWKN